MTAEPMRAGPYRQGVLGRPGGSRAEAAFFGLVIGLSALAGVIVVVVGRQLYRVGNATPFLLTGVACVAVIVRERRIRRIGLSPLVAALLTYLVIFSLVPLFELNLGDANTYPRAWDEASWMVLWGVPLVYIGFLAGLKSVNRRPGLEPGRP